MDLPELDAQIELDTARETPPFGAPSIVLAREFGAGATDLLLEKIHGGEPAAFLALEALRDTDREAFDRIRADLRAQIYVTRLRGNTFFNAWGLPGYSLTPTSAALIGLGEAAVSVLFPLLTDTSRALMAGSQDATTSRNYQNRICDYAWVLISEARTIPYTYSQTPEHRDDQIASLLASLKQQGTEQP